MMLADQQIEHIRDSFKRITCLRELVCSDFDFRYALKGAVPSQFLKLFGKPLKQTLRPLKLLIFQTTNKFYDFPNRRSCKGIFLALKAEGRIRCDMTTNIHCLSPILNIFTSTDYGGGSVVPSSIKLPDDLPLIVYLTIASSATSISTAVIIALSMLICAFVQSTLKRRFK